MLGYRFKAYDKKGKFHSGILLMNSEDEAISFLIRNDLTPVEVKLIPQTLIFKFLSKLIFRISFSQKMFLVRNLHLILKSGISLDKGLQILIEESKGSLRDFLFYLSYNLQKGEPFYKAFESFPEAFSRLEIATLRAGEIAGTLVDNLGKWAENLERQREIRNEIISSILYPAIVILLSFGVLVLLVTFVLPKIGVLLKEIVKNPPLFTKILLAISTFVNNNLTLIILIFVLTFIILIATLIIKKTRDYYFKLFFKLPFISRIYFNLSLSQALFVLGSLLKAGIPLDQALNLTKETISHPSIRRSLIKVYENVKKGKKLDISLREADLPAILSSILGVAAETGTLEETLKIMEDYYLEEFRNDVRNFLNLLQPILIIFVGIVVGIVAIGIVVPIYQQVSSQLQIERGGTSVPGTY